MNQLLPQPPPNAPPPPPSGAALRSQKWRHWIWTVGILSVVGVICIAVFLPVTRNPFYRRHRGCGMSEPVNNARQIGIALFEFETEYGSFPDSVTSLPVDKSGQVRIGGKDLFDPTQSFWSGKAPDVKWPE